MKIASTQGHLYIGRCRKCGISRAVNLGSCDWLLNYYYGQSKPSTWEPLKASMLKRPRDCSWIYRIHRYISESLCYGSWIRVVQGQVTMTVLTLKPGSFIWSADVCIQILNIAKVIWSTFPRSSKTCDQLGFFSVPSAGGKWGRFHSAVNQSGW